MKLNRFEGLSLFRRADRQTYESPFQLPPRMTREGPLLT